MTSRDFCYWLQGYFEIETLVSNKPDEPTLTVKQVQMIKNHLGMVFKHEIDPSMGDKIHQALLTGIHSPDLGSGKINC